MILFYRKPDIPTIRLLHHFKRKIQEAAEEYKEALSFLNKKRKASIKPAFLFLF
jgi:hypothetical protein